MAGYSLEGPKAARMYEVILPKKLGYFGKVQEVLEGPLQRGGHPVDPVHPAVDRRPTPARLDV